MQQDDEAPLTLSKWPFYLGDLLLVVAALAIGMLSEWPLTGMQVVSCVTAVALGATILGLPFVVEYWMRVREEQDDRSSELHLLKGHLQKAEAALLQCHERLNELESGSGSVDQRCELLAAAVDQKLNTASQGLTTLSQQVGVIEVFKAEQTEAFTALKDQIDKFSAAPKDDVSAAAVTALQTALAALEVRLTETVEPLDTIESRVVTLEENAKVVEVAIAEATATTEPEAPTPARAPRQRRKKADAGLLHRAIKEKQDSASSAVSRIIDSKSKLVEPEPVAQESDPEVTETTESPEEALPQEPESKVAPEVTETPELEELVVELDPVAAPEAIEALPEDIEVSLGADLIEDDELLGATAEPEESTAEDLIVEVIDGAVEEPISEGEAAAEPETEPEVAAATKTEETPESEPDAPVDLFGEAEPATIRRARTKANDAVFTVSILIGIGNKPFLRGSAGGLSWETGVPMDFEEIGKWRWVAPADLDGPVELQIYRNDEDADRKGRHILEPGQKLEVTPVF